MDAENTRKALERIRERYDDVHDEESADAREGMLCGLLDAALDELEKALAPSPWRPMSEAPRDGTRVLLRTFGLPNQCTVGEWAAPLWWTDVGSLDECEPTPGGHGVGGWHPLLGDARG